jgi:hypothetical protein
MALNQTQQDKLMQLVHESTILTLMDSLQASITMHANLNDFNSIKGAYDSNLVNSIFEGEEFRQIGDSLWQRITTEKIGDEQDIDEFLQGLLHTEKPALYNFFKAMCFLDLAHELNQESGYPITVTHQHHHENVTHTFNNSAEYFMHEVKVCADDYALPTSIDEQINEYVAHTLEEMQSTAYDSGKDEL